MHTFDANVVFDKQKACPRFALHTDIEQQILHASWIPIIKIEIMWEPNRARLMPYSSLQFHEEKNIHNF